MKEQVMRTMFFSKYSPLVLLSAALVFPGASSAQTGSYTNAFDTDPTLDPNLIIRSLAGGGTWRSSGSHDGSGYVSLTDAANGQAGTLVLPDLSQGGVGVSAFRFVAKLRVGGGTARPADGFSISFGDDPNGDVGEEGTTTGLTLNFDTWDNGNGEAPAIELKWNNAVVARKRFAGDAESAGPGYLLPERDAAGVPVAIQTDPAGTGAGGTPVWTDLDFSISAAGAATVRYKGLDIFRDVVVPGWSTPAPRSGRFIIGARTGNANEAHWIDNIGITTSEADSPPLFASTTPAANPAAHLNEYTETVFVIDEGVSFEDVDRASIRVSVNGVDVTADAVIEPDVPAAGQITVRYAPAPAPTSLGYPPGSRQEVVVTFSTALGVPYTARKQLRITEVPAMTTLGPPLFIEAEDFNYSEGGVHGQYFDFGSPAGSYNAKAAQFGVDYFQGDSNPDSPLYRVLNPPNGIVGIGDNNRPGVGAITPDYKVGWNGANDAYNFTRTFPNSTYKIYGRFSSGDLALNSHGRSTLSRVTSNPAESNQTIVDVGFFDFQSTGGWDTFIGYQPLRDAQGNELIIRLNGLTTFRHTTRPGAYDVNYFAFVPTFTTNILYPTAAMSPPNGGQTTVRDNFPIRISITDENRDTQVIPSSIKLFFDGVEVAPPVGTPITITDTAGGAEAEVRITNSPAFGPHTATGVFCDNSSPSVCFTQTVTFTVSPLKSGTNTLFIEAEDFNYTDDGVTGGLHANFGDPSCPTQNKDGILNVDYFEVNDANDGGAVPAYRPATGVEAAKPGTDGFARGDQTITCTYIIGWTDNGDWYNYTRDFGAGARYNVYARMASGGGAEGARLDRITSDPAQPNQTIEPLGQFNSPPTGNWDTFHFVPLRGPAGELVNIRLTGEQTLRYTKMPVDSDINYLAFVRADVQFFTPTLQSATPAPDSQNAGNVIRAVIRDQDSQVNPASLRLFVNGQNVTSTATVTDTADGAEISIPIGRNLPGSTHTVRVEWQDNQGTPVSGAFQWQFTDFYNGGLNLFIEAEDFNTASGDFLPSKPGTPFNAKGLYNGLPATPNTDYNDAGDAMESNLYRTEGVANVPHVNMVGTPDTTATGGGPRPGFETLTDYKIGWTNPNTDWYNYTRDFGAATDYQVYVRIAHGDGAATMGGRLELLDDPSVPTSTNQLGTFRAPATAGWDTFTFVPLRDAGNQLVRLPLSGVRTLRYTVEANGGDINYLMFAPLVPVNGPLTISRNGNNVTITWPNGNLQSAPAITGPWGTETGATSPLQLNNTSGMRFYRTITP
jgi:hypothetical protein